MKEIYLQMLALKNVNACSVLPLSQQHEEQYGRAGITRKWLQNYGGGCAAIVLELNNLIG